MLEVHWHEGLFLQPQHLQAMQRQGVSRLAGERRLANPYPYGIVEAKLSTDDLANMRVRFDRLHAVMPSGLHVQFPESAELPSLDIKRAFASSAGPLVVSLGVPLYYPKRGNCVQGDGVGPYEKKLFRVAETQFADENTGENAQPVLVRKVNARLLLQTDDDGDMETIPLVRIVPGTGASVGTPKVDPAFVPACYTLAGSAVLRDLCRDLSNQIEASRDETVVQLTRGGYNVETLRGGQLAALLRLRTLNTYAGRLPTLVRSAGALPPVSMYLELRGMLGELAALHPDTDLFDAPAYDHDNPAVAFMEIAQRVRQLLRPVSQETWMKVAFAPEESLLVASLTEEHLTRANEYFLAVRSGADPRALAALVEDADKFKLMPASMAHNRVRGVRLTEERHPPVQLPAQVGLHYFRLMRADSVRAWERVEAERKLAINYAAAEGVSFDEVALYMTVPEGGR